MADTRGGPNVDVLLSLARELARFTEPRDIFQCVADVVMRVVGVDASASLTVDHDAGVLRVEGLCGWPEGLAEAVAGFEIPIDASPLVGEVTARPDPSFVTPDLDDPVVAAVFTEFESDAALVVPIAARGEVIGLVAGVKRGGSETELPAGVLDTLQGVADQAATALDRAGLYAALQRQVEAAEAAEHEADQARSVLEHLLDSGPVIAFRGSTDGFRITYVSANVDRLFGYDAETFLEQRWLEFVHPDDVEGVWTAVLGLLEVEAVETTLRFRDAAGAYHWLRVHLRGDMRQAAEDREVLGYVWDETDQREAEERYRRVSELTSDLAYAYHLDAAGEPVIEWQTEGIERLTGYTVDEAIALGGWRGMVVPDHRARYEERIQRVLDGEHVVEEFLILTKEGQQRWLEVSATPAAGFDGGLRVFGAVRDVTDRHRALDQLAEREQQLREAQGIAGVGSWRFDMARGVVEFSPEMAALFDIAPGEHPADALLNLVLAEDQALLIETSERARDTRATADCEFRFVRSDGTVHWMYLRVDAEVDEGGHFVATKGSIQDVTERKRAEEYFRVISDTVSDVAFAYSLREGTLALDWVSDAWERLTGYPAPEPGAELFVPVAHPDDLAGIRETEARVLDGERRVDEFRIRVVDGQWRWLRIYAIPVRHEVSGEVVGVYGAAQDVTERRLAVEAVAESEARLRQLVQASPLAVLVFEPGGRLSMVNPAAEALFGWTQADVETMSGVPPWIPEGYEGEFTDLARRMAAGERITGYETQRLSRDGRLLEVALSAAPLDRGPGQTPGAVIVVVDMSDRRRLEDELRQAQKMTAIGRLAGGVAHDFNNILTTILGHAEFLNTDPVSEPMVREHARAITGAGERAAALTEQMLLLSRHRTPVAEVFDLRDEVRDMHSLLSRLIGEDITYEVDAGDSACFVRAPRAHIQQIMLNLVVNARDAMPSGGRLCVKTRFEPSINGRPARVVLRVSDSGEGMDADTQERVFEPFFTTKDTGNGLGLSVVYGIVDNNGGEISIESQPGQGTTFVISLPEALDGPADEPLPPVRRGASGAVSVLLVEDEADVRGVTATALRRRGYEVSEARDALEALTMADSGAPVDVVISDVVMPHMGGVELARRLRARRPDLRVLLVSGYAEEVSDADVEDAGARFLQKPFTPDELLRAVEALVGEAAAVTDAR